MAEMLYPSESYEIIGACFEVYNRRGFGFLEPVYQECLQIEFEYRGIPHLAKPRLELSYRGRKLARHYEPDFICYGKIIVELKCASVLNDDHRARTIHYLRASGLQLAILVNFGARPKLEYERFVLTTPSSL
jgi:GxxExxY protein